MTVTRLNPEYQPIGDYAAASHTHTDVVKTVTFRPSGTVPANGTYDFTASVNNQSGWVPIAIAGFSANSPGLVAVVCQLNNANTAQLTVRNLYGSAVTVTPYLHVLYRRA